MKEYTRPNAEIVVVEVEDIITASGEIVDAATLMGDDATMYEIYKENSSVDNQKVSVFTW